MAFALKDIETRKTASITTTIAIAMLVAGLAFPSLTNVAFSQTSANDFQEFMECLFGDVGGSAATAQDIQDVLQGSSDDVTEQEIRDCFEPIYEPAGTATGPATTLGPTIGATDGEDGDETTGGESEGEDEEG